MIKLLQPTYINKVFNKFHLDKAYAVNILMKKIALFKQKTEKKASSSEKKRYQGIIRTLMFSIVETRSNITFATSVTNCFTKNLGHQYTGTVKTILQYLKALNK